MILSYSVLNQSTIQIVPDFLGNKIKMNGSEVRADLYFLFTSLRVCVG